MLLGDRADIELLSGEEIKVFVWSGFLILHNINLLATIKTHPAVRQRSHRSSRLFCPDGIVRWRIDISLLYVSTAHDWGLSTPDSD